MKTTPSIALSLVIAASAMGQVKNIVKNVSAANLKQSIVLPNQTLRADLVTNVEYGDPIFLVDKELISLMPFIKTSSGELYAIPYEYMHSDARTSGKTGIPVLPTAWWISAPAVPAGTYTMVFGDPDLGIISPKTFKVKIQPHFSISIPSSIDEDGQGYVSGFATNPSSYSGSTPPLVQVNATTLDSVPNAKTLSSPTPVFSFSSDRPDVIQVGSVVHSTSDAYGAQLTAVGLGSATITISSSDPGFTPIKRVIPVNERQRPMPIVFVPGTAGSELHFASDNSLFWLGQQTLAPSVLDRAKTEPMIATQPVQNFNLPFAQNILNQLSPIYPIPGTVAADVYGVFETWARSTFQNIGYYSAPYDWRHGASDESARAIDAVVDKALREHPGAKKVILVAHSLGGIVARNYLQGLGKTKVGSLVAVGTPWFGAPKTARALTWGYNFDVGKFIDLGFAVTLQEKDQKSNFTWYPRISMLDLNKGKAGAANWECVYQMLPLDDYQRLFGQLLKDSSQSLVWKNSHADTKNLLRATNQSMFDGAANKMSSILDGNDYGINHYLISGYTTSPAGAPNHQDSMDLQIALPSQINFFTDASFWKKWTGWQAFVDLERNGSTAIPYLDHFVATVSDNSYGDGTSPILSATVGQWLAAGSPNPNGYPTSDKKKSALGSLYGSITNESGKVYVYPPVDLGTEGNGEFLNHGSMLRSKPVLDKIIDSYYKRTGLSVTESKVPNVISSIQVQITSKGYFSGGPTVNTVTATIPGCNVETWLFGRECLDDTLDFPFNSLTGKRYYEEELDGKQITITNLNNRVDDDWNVQHIVVRVNGKVWLDQTGPWNLKASNDPNTLRTSFTLKRP